MSPPSAKPGSSTPFPRVRFRLGQKLGLPARGPGETPKVHSVPARKTTTAGHESVVAERETRAAYPGSDIPSGPSGFICTGVAEHDRLQSPQPKERAPNGCLRLPPVWFYVNILNQIMYERDGVTITPGPSKAHYLVFSLGCSRQGILSNWIWYWISHVIHVKSCKNSCFYHVLLAGWQESSVPCMLSAL